MEAPLLALNPATRVKLVTGRMPGMRGTVIPAEKELGDGPRRPGVDLALQVVDVVLGAFRFRVDFRVGGDADFEVGDLLQPRHQVGRIGVAAGVGPVAILTFGRVATQRHDVLDTSLPIGACDVVYFFPCRPDAGQMCHDLHSGGALGLKGDLFGERPGRPAGPVGYRHKVRAVHLQLVQGLQYRRNALGVTGRKELERDGARFFQYVFDLQAGYPMTAG